MTDLRFLLSCAPARLPAGAGLSQLAPAHLDELRRLAPILDQLVVGDG